MNPPMSPEIDANHDQSTVQTKQCSVEGHEPIEIFHAGVAPQFGMCARCGRRLNPAYTVDVHQLAAALALPPSPKNRGITA